MKARKVIMIILATLFLLPDKVYGDSVQTMKQLDNISNEALQMVRAYRYEDAKKLLNHFEKEFLNFTESGQLFSMDELRIITVSHDEALEAIESSTIDHQGRMDRVTQFRLVMDAVVSTHQPLWTEMEGSIMTVFGGMKAAIQNGDNEEFYTNLDSFLALYDVIYPSLKIDVNPEKFQQLNTRVAYIDQYRPNILLEEKEQGQLEALEHDLKNLFSGITEDETDPSIWWVMISTGSIIIMTLSYVGHRKYRAEKERRLKRLKERKN